MMKNELDVYRMKLWSYVMLILLVLAVVIAWPLYYAYDLLGFIPSGILFVLAIVSAVAVERIKNKHNVQTYSEIVAFVEGKQLDEGKVPWSRQNEGLATLLKLAGGAVFGFVLVVACYFIFTALLG